MLALLAHSWRTWKHAPSVAILAILALALGVTATTAIYTFIQAVLLNPLPYANPDRYLLIRATYRGTSLEGAWSYPNCVDFSKRNHTMAVLGCVAYQGENLTMGKRTLYAQGIEVKPGLVHSLGVPLQQGAWFSDGTGDLRTAVISDQIWRAFGSPPDVIGSRMMVNSVPYAIRGVAKPWFRFPIGHSGDIWYPLDPSPENRKSRDNHFLSCFAKMKPGVTEAQAAADMSRIAAELEHAFPDIEANHTAAVVSLLRAETNKVRPTFLLLFAAATALLLIACGNVASLLLARAVARARETAVRVAIGAASWQLAIQYVSEGLLVALAGAALGLLGSMALVKLVLHFAVSAIPRAEEIQVDARVLFVTLAASLLCGLLFSLAPLWQAMRISPNAVLTNGTRASAGSGAQRVLGIFVTLQIALSCALLTVAILCVQRLGFLSHVDAGFDSRDTTIFSTYLPAARFPNDTARADYQTRLLNALQNARLAGTVGLTSLLPFTNNSGDTIVIPDHKDVSHIGFDEAIRLYDYQLREVSPEFFPALRIPLTSGRYLTASDVQPKSFGVVISETVARNLWPHTDAVGHTLGFAGDDKRTAMIVGVVGDVRDQVNTPARGHVYVPYQAAWVSFFPMEWALRTRPGGHISSFSIERVIHTVDPQLAVYDVSTMERRKQEFLGVNTLQSDVVSAFGGAALVLAVLGVFGVVSYTVRQRVPEMGTRLALGATGNGLLYLVLRQALVKAAIGCALGCTVVLASIPLLQKLDVHPHGIGPFLVSLTLVILSTLVAALLPAWRASLLSPMIALRDAPDSLWRRARREYRNLAQSVTSLMAQSATGTNSAEAALLAEIAESTRDADSFATAIRAALLILIERVPASSAILLVRRAQEEPFRCISAVPATATEWSLPFDSILLNRLAHYYPALPFTQADLEALERWAEETQSEHRAEISTLRSIGPAVVIPVSVKSGIAGILFVRPPSGVIHFDGHVLRLLRSVASQLALMIENSHLTDRIVEQERFRRDMALASEVQKRLFPEKAPDVRTAQLVAYCLPARGVGGDYYDFFRIGSDQIGVALADVAGKGVPAALVMSIVQASLRSLTEDPVLPLAQITGKVNRLLCASTGPSSYATFFYGKFDENTRSLSYVNGGHNPPFVLRNHGSGEIEELTTGGMIIGMFPFCQYEEGKVQLQPGDVLLLFTDGVSEAHNPAEEEFGEERLKDLLRRHRHLPAEGMSAAILDDLKLWMLDAPQHDDLTFLLMKVS